MNKETKTKRRRGWSARARVGVPLPVNQLFTQHLSLVLNLWYEFIIFRNTGMLESNVKVRSRTRRTGNPPNCAINRQTPLCARRTTSNLGDLRARSPRLFCIRPSSSHRSVTRRRALSTHCIRQIPRRGRFLPTLPSDTRQVSSQAVRGRESALSAVQCVHAQMALL